MTKEQIARINALAKKAKEEGLSAAESAEQADLRKEYIAAFRGDLKRQLDTAVVLNPDGTTSKLHRKDD